MEVDLRRLQRQAAEGADRHRQLKVAVIGPTGSGKTTFARALAEKLGLPHIELDVLFWKPGWVESSAEELRANVEPLLAADGWVVDGNYSGKLGTYVIDQADEIVWLDLPLRTTWPRLVRRTVRRLVTREVICGSNRESFRQAFLSRQSILLYALRTYRRTRASRTEWTAGYPVTRLRSQHDVERYLA
jgi:adenylate kinase family enzyme